MDWKANYDTRLDLPTVGRSSSFKRRFANREVTTGQIVAFGLTGGLIPCLAAITVLSLCLQLKRFTLGASLVLRFSIGLAVTMVAADVVATISVKQVQSRWPGFETFARRAPPTSRGQSLSRLVSTLEAWVFNSSTPPGYYDLPPHRPLHLNAPSHRPD